MGTALKRHKVSIDVIVHSVVHVDLHHEIKQINTRNKILQKELQCICCNQFSFLFFYLLFLSFFLLCFVFKFRTSYFFLAFNYTIVSKLSQLKKTHKKQNFTLTYFMLCLKIIFLAFNPSNLIKRLPLERKLKNAINKINSLAKVSYFLKKMIIKVKLQNTEKPIFRRRQRERRRAMT